MHGAISAGDSQTAAAGAAILRQGGNAVDAVVAAAFASFVAESVLVNIGGGGIGLVYTPTSNDRLGEAWAYDFFSVMPTRPMYPGADFREVIVDFGPAQQPFYIGRASVAVPGVVAGLCQMARRNGSLPLSRLLTPAIQLARAGVKLSPALGFVSNLLTDIFTDTPELAATFAPTGRVVQPGEQLVMPELASTLERLGQEGASLFYTGDVGEAIVADQAQNGGLVTGEDLAEYRVRRRPPIQVAYREYTVLLPPPASGGGVLIAFTLSLLAGLPVGSLAHNSAEHLSLLAEAMHQTNLARRDWEISVGPNSQRIQRFLAPQHVESYRTALTQTRSANWAQPEHRFPNGHRDTTHISVIDADGMIATVTTTAGENAGFVVGNTGVCLNNMLGEEDLHPNGFHRLAPGERLTTMMSPAIVLKDGEPILAIGSGGSSRIRSAILQALSNVLDFGMPLDEAIHAPRVHFEHGILQAEGGIEKKVVDELRQSGYDVNHWPAANMYFGGAHAVARHNGELIAVGDTRRGGSVAMA